MLIRPLSVVVDGASAIIILGAFAQVLPPIAAFFAGMWYLVQIYESRTVQTWAYRHRIRRWSKKLRDLEAKKIVILAELDATEKVRTAQAYAAERLEEAKSDAGRGMHAIEPHHHKTRAKSED